MIMKYAVSVIVPMFKVEHFVGKCAQHLFEQTLDSLEIIFVDDCSPDRSGEVVFELLKNYPHRKEAVKIIRHEKNKGLPSARNTGLNYAQGEYVFHCDGDDWLERTGLEDLYLLAKKEDAEVVFCDWLLSFKNNERLMSQNPGFNHINSKQYIELILGGKLKYNVWNKLVLRELYLTNNIQFPDGFGMGEDMTMIKVIALANKVSYLPKAIYHYVQLNNEAFTKKPSENHYSQIKHNVDSTILFLEEYFGESINDYINFFKLNVKLPFLISSDVTSYQRWLTWYPEANKSINSNPMFNFRTKFIQKAAINGQFWIIKAYYFLIIRVVYGLLYK